MRSGRVRGAKVIPRGEGGVLLEGRVGKGPFTLSTQILMCETAKPKGRFKDVGRP